MQVQDHYSYWNDQYWKSDNFLSNRPYVDVADDYKDGVAGCGNSSAEVSMIRFNLAVDEDKRITNTSYTQLLYSFIDGVAVQPVYIYDTDEYYFKACPDNRTLQEYSTLTGEGADPCDVVEPFQVIGGLDAFPFLGWWGIDTRNWVDGETHTYEFGTLTECITAKYIITAKAPPTKSPTKAPTKSPTKAPTKSPTKAPTKGDKCGLFGLGLFCPFEWLKWFFNLFK